MFWFSDQSIFIFTDDQSIFSLGAVKKDTKDQTKKVAEGDNRMSAFGVGEDKKDVKRERDNFAVNLRKQKR